MEERNAMSTLEEERFRFNAFIESFNEGDPSVFVEALKATFPEWKLLLKVPSGAEYSIGPISSRQEFVTLVFPCGGDSIQIDVQLIENDGGLKLIVYKRPVLDDYLQRLKFTEEDLRRSFLRRLEFCLYERELEGLRSASLERIRYVLEGELGEETVCWIEEYYVPNNPVIKIWSRA